MKNSLRSIPASPEAMAEISTAAERILQQHGTENYPRGYGNPNEPNMLSARVPIETSALPAVPKKTADVNPSISIDKPIGSTAKEFSWAYGITYNMYPNAQLSILIGKSALRATVSTYPSDMAYYDGYDEDDLEMEDNSIANPPHLTEAEARAIASDLHNAIEPKTP